MEVLKDRVDENIMVKTENDKWDTIYQGEKNRAKKILDCGIAQTGQVPRSHKIWQKRQKSEWIT